ncbi:MAG: hypothetical protein K6F80_07440 [Oscillospiraceae bacterium]|nr:hypothetical protein [Oscillospiraceae bacterium]
MKRGNKNRMIAGVFAVLFVLSTAVTSVTAFAEEEVKVPALSEVTAQTAGSGFDTLLGDSIVPIGGNVTTLDNSFLDAVTMQNSFTMPESIAAGQTVQIYGRVESGTSALTSVSVAVYQVNNTAVAVQGKAVVPNSNAFDISSLSNEINFAALPADSYYFVVMASNASYRNTALMVKRFTVVGGASATDGLGISNPAQVPSVINQGTSLNVTGIVSSSISPLTRVVAAVYDTNGNAQTGGQANNINATTYDVSRLAPYVQFNKLGAGSYVYRVSASNSTETDKIVQEARFTVSGSGGITPIVSNDALTGNIAAIPSVLTQGSQVTISGTVNSGYSALTYVSAAVYDAYGNLKFGQADAPHTTTYNIGTLAPYLNFASLGAGTYRYVVTATNGANSNVTLADQTFTVQANTQVQTTDTIGVTGVTIMPSSIRVGQPVSVRGTVSSAYSNLTKVAVEVYDSYGNFKTGKTVSVNARTYNLYNLDRYVYFDRLTDGAYEFRVTCSNGSLTDFIVSSQKFAVGTGTVTPNNVDSATDRLYLTNVFKMPASISRGQIVNVTGTVSSASTNLVSVGVNVYNSANKIVTGSTVNPRSKSFDLRNLDKSVSFNTLPDGVYTLVIHGSNGTRTNEILLQQQFTVGTGGGSVSATDSMYISGFVPIASVRQAGQGVDVTGVVTSPVTNLSMVDVGIFNSAGQRLYGQTVYPNARTYDLKLQDNSLRFDLLPANQEYTFKVTASNGSASNVVLATQRFTVTTSAVTPGVNSDAITVSGITQIPDNIAAGTPITVNGTVTSAQSNIYSLYCGVFNSAGQAITGRTVNPNSRTYNLHALDPYIEFNKLANGQTYTFAVIASNSSNTNYTVYSKKFTVGYGGTTTPTTPTTDTMTISGETQIPASIAYKQPVSVKGYITSAYSNITNVSVGVYNTANLNQMVVGSVKNVNARTYNLSAMDSEVRFDLLPQGSYVYVVKATNASGTYTLQNKSFTVGYGTSTTTPSTQTGTDLYVTGVSTVPSSLSVGAVFSVRGTVTSTSSNITTLTCGVWDVNTQKWMTGANSVTVNAKTFDLSRVDSQVHFNSLPAGSYVFGVYASNATRSNVTLVSQRFTVGSGGSVTPSVSGDNITFNNTMSLGSSIRQGSPVSVRGTVSSGSSNLTNVTVGIYNASGAGLYVSPVNPGARSYNISAVDSAMRFDRLSAGTYYFRVTASNGSTSNVQLVNKSFTVY